VGILSRLEDISPGRLCALVWITLAAGSALTAVGPTYPHVEAIGSLLALTSIYGYPTLLSFMPPLRVAPRSRRLVLACPSAIAILFVVSFLTGTSPGYQENGAPAWSYPIGLATGVAIFVPLIIAAGALRCLEFSVGRNITLGGMSAFLWLFYWPVGTYFFHRRLLYALHLRSITHRITPA
jgi:hypothetical protein